MADQTMHLMTLDGHALSTWALHEAARRWHEAHDQLERATVLSSYCLKGGLEHRACSGENVDGLFCTCHCHEEGHRR